MTPVFLRSFFTSWPLGEGNISFRSFLFDRGTFVLYINRSRSLRERFLISPNMEIAKMLADPILLSRDSKNFCFCSIIRSVSLGTGSEDFSGAPNRFLCSLLFLSPNFSELPPVRRGASALASCQPDLFSRLSLPLRPPEGRCLFCRCERFFLLCPGSPLPTRFGLSWCQQFFSG